MTEMSSDGGKQAITQTMTGSVILVLLATVSFFVRIFSVVRYESMIHEFDPYFNYRSLKYLVMNGHSSFREWFDFESWYPLGRHVGNTVYPGIMYTAASLYYFLNTLAILRKN